MKQCRPTKRSTETEATEGEYRQQEGADGRRAMGVLRAIDGSDTEEMAVVEQ
jgi:hypothetical protein